MALILRACGATTLVTKTYTVILSLVLTAGTLLSSLATANAQSASAACTGGACTGGACTGGDCTGGDCTGAACTGAACAGDCSPYPESAYNARSVAPLPGEAPRSYFARQLQRSRGGYDGANVNYEVFPEGQQPQPAPQEGAASPEGFASYNNAEPSDFSQSYVEDYAPQEPCGPTNRKPGVFQKWAWRATHIPRSGGDDMGVLDLETWVVFGLPFPTRDSPLLITPGFASRLLDGPNAVDLPETLYDVYVQFRWLGKWNDTWGYDLVFTPGVYTDFKTDSDEVWRFTGRAVATYQWSAATQVIFGVGYFDREDFSTLPIAGAIYTPCDDVRWEFIFPRPRYARRYYAACDREDWWYIAGEFGGGSWAIERTGGVDDIVTLRDYRLLIGKETKLNGGARRSFEFGYVFGREIEFNSVAPTVELDSNFIVRGGITF